MTGRIIKSLSGFYYVKSGPETVRCRARGKFKADSLSPAVGDSVEYTVLDDGSGIIEIIHPRKNSFTGYLSLRLLTAAVFFFA